MDQLIRLCLTQQQRLYLIFSEKQKMEPPIETQSGIQLVSHFLIKRQKVMGSPIQHFTKSSVKSWKKDLLIQLIKAA